VSIGELLGIACRVLGVKAVARREERRLRPDASEVLVLEAEPSRARERLGWAASVTLEEGVRRTADWLRTQRHQYGSDFGV
jgi:UDP-glucose 4-epimerase